MACLKIILDTNYMKMESKYVYIPIFQQPVEPSSMGFYKRLFGQADYHSMPLKDLISSVELVECFVRKKPLRFELHSECAGTIYLGGDLKIVYSLSGWLAQQITREDFIRFYTFLKNKVYDDGFSKLTIIGLTEKEKQKLFASEL